MGKRICLGHGCNVRNSVLGRNLPIGNRRRRGFVEFVDLDDDDSDDLGDGADWAEVLGGTGPGASRPLIIYTANGGGGANK